jgi:hypothetical protein
MLANQFEKSLTDDFASPMREDQEVIYSMLRSLVRAGSYGTETSVDTACAVLAFALSNKLIRLPRLRGLCYALSFLSKEEIDSAHLMLQRISSWVYYPEVEIPEKIQSIIDHVSEATYHPGDTLNHISEMKKFLHPLVIQRLISLGCPKGLFVQNSGVSPL